MRLRPRTLGLAAALAISSAVVAGAAPATAAPDVELKAASVGRVYGADRIGTAVAASKSFTGGQAKAVVLARADDYADSLAAAPLASDLGGPLLLTGSGSLDPAVSAAISDVLVQGGTVYLLGGEKALSANVGTQVRALGKVGDVRRVAGGDRFGTAVEIAKLLPTAKSVAVVTGWNFPDGLSAGALMGVVDVDTDHSIGVVLLSDGRSLGRTTSDYLAGRTFTNKLAIGGDARTAVAGDTSGWVPLVGSDRYDTSARVAATFTSDSFFTDATTIVGVATGEGWADALSGSALLAYGGGPLLLTARDGLPSSTTGALKALQADAKKNGETVEQALVFGGPNVVGTAVDGQIGSALQ
ncbi:cell wall-binding repeat-containing protein [Kineococcus sp. SYSU DK003]|uniref:cell wall-binding repeat-containing protein n=1 Tax=Kineococcus sp. SYSU DK003 TaxID=3383124 RepID=UPI003D7C73F2